MCDAIWETMRGKLFRETVPIEVAVLHDCHNGRSAKEDATNVPVTRARVYRREVCKEMRAEMRSPVRSHADDHAERVGTRPRCNWGPPEWWWVAAEAGPRA